MSVKGATRPDWITVKIPKSLYQDVQKVVKNQRTYEYESVPHFIRKACISLLERQEKKKEVIVK